MRVARLAVTVCGLSASGLLCAAEPEAPKGLKPLADAPLPPERIESEEALEPEVTIIQKIDATVEEYRANGHLYRIKVTPVVGKPYYLTGPGWNIETQMSALYSNFTVPQWVIFSW